jgi:hypothetical protein
MHILIVQHLRDMQRALEQQNGIAELPPVDQFLITPDERAALPGSNPNTPEQIFVSEDDRLGVFIDEGTLERATKQSFNDYCVVAEGVSHFLMLADRANADRQVSLLELELQAEVDKFVHLTQKLELAPGSPDQAALHDALFERYGLHSHLDPNEVARYEAATKNAARFCYRISKNAKRFYPEARAFYSMPLEAKLRSC